MKYKILKISGDSKYPHIWIHLIDDSGKEDMAILDVKKLFMSEIEGRIVRKRVRPWFIPEPNCKWKIINIKL